MGGLSLNSSLSVECEKCVMQRLVSPLNGVSAATWNFSLYASPPWFLGALRNSCFTEEEPEASDTKSLCAPRPWSAFQTPCVPGLRTGPLGRSALQQTPSSSARHAIGVKQTQSWLPKILQPACGMPARLKACLQGLWAEVHRLLMKTSSNLQRNGDTAFGLQS